MQARVGSNHLNQAHMVLCVVTGMCKSEKIQAKRQEIFVAKIAKIISCRRYSPSVVAHIVTHAKKIK